MKIIGEIFNGMFSYRKKATVQNLVRFAHIGKLAISLGAAFAVSPSEGIVPERHHTQIIFEKCCKSYKNMSFAFNTETFCKRFRLCKTHPLYNRRQKIPSPYPKGKNSLPPRTMLFLVDYSELS